MYCNILLSLSRSSTNVAYINCTSLDTSSLNDNCGNGKGTGAEGQRGRGAEGQRGRGAEGQRGRGAEGQRGRGAEGQRCRGAETYLETFLILWVGFKNDDP